MKSYAGLQKGKEIRCSRCFDRPGEICRYGCDEQGFWFIAPCKSCGAWIKWYRSPEGETFVEKEETSFIVDFVDGEAVLSLAKE